ncbi:hypothetical protein Tsubulata_028614 [Turnera subulata]|uniref:Protein PIR n=1 Tax=Turnera subulata TaxID=218843 RepID=A0A9Q0FKW9_9ROSI|nr:hypothetical protein Tsubulata_028614 [Turnera subulata]
MTNRKFKDRRFSCPAREEPPPDSSPVGIFFSVPLLLGIQEESGFPSNIGQFVAAFSFSDVSVAFLCQSVVMLLPTYRLSLSEDTEALNQLLPESMKHSADLCLETYQVLDLEMSRIREIQRWQASASSKLAADMQWFSGPERRINGPSITHLWTFTQVSVQWQDIDSMREELDDLQCSSVEDILQVLIVFAVESLELDFAILFPRHYLITNHIGNIRAEHDDFTIRFASSLNQLLVLKSLDGADIEWCKEVKGSFTEERKALVETISYIKSVGSKMHRCDSLAADASWETIHAEVQDFVHNTLAPMLRTTFRKKKDLSRWILCDMRTLSADWTANTSKPESELQSHGGDESKGNFFYPRPVAPTAAEIHCLQSLIYEVVSGGNLRKPGGPSGNSGSEIPVNDLKQLEMFFYKLSFFLHILDYSAQQALSVVRQRFLYHEIEAEVDHCFDIFVSKLCELFSHSTKAGLQANEAYFTIYDDQSEGSMCDSGKLLTSHHIGKELENLLNILKHAELENLLNILKHTHELLSKDLSVDSFNVMMNEMQENISLVSFSSRFASQVWSEMQSDFLPNFVLCNTTQHFVRSSRVPLVPVQKPSVQHAKSNFYCGTEELNSAHQSYTRLHGGFFGIPHMFSIVRLLGSRSLPWLSRALLDYISNKVTTLEPMITGLQEAEPRFSGGYLEESVLVSINHEIFGDLVAWGGFTIIYLLGQQLHLELFDFSYQVLNVAKVEAGSLTQAQKNPHLA